MKKITIIRSGLTITVFVLATGFSVVEAQQRPIRLDADLPRMQEHRSEMMESVHEVQNKFHGMFEEDVDRRNLNADSHVVNRANNRPVMIRQNQNTSGDQPERRDQMGIHRVEMREIFENRLANMPEEQREEFLNRFDDRLEMLQAKREEMLSRAEGRRARLAGERKERVEQRFDNIFGGFANVAGKLSSIHDRLESKIIEMEENGEDVGEAVSLIETAESLLNDTLAEIEAVQAELDEAVEGEITSEYIRELIAGIKESAKATRAAYRAVIAEINQ